MIPFCKPLLLIMIALLCGPGYAFYNVTLSNADMTDYSSGVAVDWNSYTTGAQLPPTLAFFADSANYRFSPFAQGISGIDTAMAAGARFGAGLWRQVAVTPGDVYMFVGYQDLYDSYYAPPPARRYLHFFGIDPHGATTPPEPFDAGPVKWMGQDQLFYNDMPGNSAQIGGMHRCMAAWPAKASQISVWSGVSVYGDAPTSLHPTVFDIDAHAIYGFSNSVQASLQNPGFESVDNLTPSYATDDVHRIAIPTYWAPIGGGFGQKESYYTDSTSKRTGSAGLRIYNQRGCLTRGVMQRVQVPARTTSATFSVWIRANRNNGAIARVGIDPTGGDDINSNAIVWNYYNRTDEAWEQESVAVTPGATSITLFLSMYNYAGSTASIHYADFDDTSLTFAQDNTPPTVFAVTAQSPWPLTSYLSATVSPVPADLESGIVVVDYAIGTTAGGQEVRGYTPCSDPAKVDAYGLGLTPGATYYVTVRATNGVGLTTTATSNAIQCTAAPCAFTSSQVTVTGTFKYLAKSGTGNVWKSVPFCCIENPSGVGGVRVITGNAQDSPIPPATIERGDLVAVSGSYSTIDGQKTVGSLTEDGTAVDASVAKVGEVTDPIRPLALCVRDLGGTTTGTKTGVIRGVGPNNVGMFVRFCGKVRAISTDERGVKVLYVDDGSKVPCGPSTGCKVCAPGSTAVVGDFVMVTGASSIEQYDPTPGAPGDESYIRVVVPVEVVGVE